MNKISHLLGGATVKWMNYSRRRDPGIWLFGEWFGKRCCDNSMYLANYVAERHPEIKVYWATKEETDCSGLRQEIQRLEFGEKETMRIYKKAGVVFMNQGYQDFSDDGYDYFSGALTVNLWHGVMWKHVGHDGSKKRGYLFNLYVKVSDAIFGANTYVATSEDYAKICETAFGAKTNGVIKAGYPRNTIFYQPEMLNSARQQVVEMLSKETGICWTDDIKIITYMPTFRDKSENSFSIEELSNNTQLMSWLENHNVVIVQKAHFITQQRHEMEGINNQKRIVTINSIQAQTLLAATDLLITDYSSCFFDFLILDRPIIHYIYDYSYYVDQDRGVYYRKEEVVCGDVAMTRDELPGLIIQNMEDPKKNCELRKIRRNAFMTYDTPDSCEVIFKAVRKRITV